MGKTILTTVTMLMICACNLALAAIVELDPGTPLSSYISLGEWDVDGDFEDWIVNQHITNFAVAGGSITGTVDSVDPIISLGISGLPGGDPRRSHTMTTGSVYEIRMRLDSSSANGRIDMFPTIDGVFKLPQLKFADNANGGLPDIPTDGAFHVYRITLDITDTNAPGYLGQLDVVRLDPIAEAPPIGETFEIDYFRIANVGASPLTVDGPLLESSTSLAEWDSDNDFESWFFIGIGSSNVSGGIMSGTPLNSDPHFFKSNGEGLPQVDLATAPYIELRLRQATLASSFEIFFGTTNNPWAHGDRSIVITSGDIPQDTNFHLYRYDMSTHADWNGALQLIRIDPYTVYPATAFEIDYIRVGSDIIPEPVLFIIYYLILVFFRRKF